MTRHVLKLWTDQFDAMKRGDKLADVRRCDDRNFLRGDEVIYRDFTAGAVKYSGRAMLARIKHLTMSAGVLQLFGRQYSEEGPLIRVVVISVEVLEAGLYEHLAATTIVDPGAPAKVDPGAPIVCARCGQPGHVASDPRKEPAGINCRRAAALKKEGPRG